MPMTTCMEYLGSGLTTASNKNAQDQANGFKLTKEITETNFENQRAGND
ncbi:MAG: hypothetical protein CM15mP8_1230 [Methanobacteriota archaeon]|nr:MAG: hypothetical protein CM15mP8_1230 [Euryarchaeota archaeon]